jgi:HPt (histidine-containing phosphotransfer) domain-containing protein
LHALKGSAGTVGARRLALLAAEAPADLVALRDSLHAYLDEVARLLAPQVAAA